MGSCDSASRSFGRGSWRLYHLLPLPPAGPDADQTHHDPKTANEDHELLRGAFLRMRSVVVGGEGISLYPTLVYVLGSQTGHGVAS